MTKLIASATPADASVCNALVPPTAGCNAGGGIHIVIPPDFAARIAQGIDVPGCTYARIESDGSMVISDQVQANLLIPADTLGLPVADVADLNTKLATAVVVTGQAQADLSVEAKLP